MTYRTSYMETWRNRHTTFYWQMNQINTKEKEVNELKDIYNRYKNHIKEIFEENSQPIDIDKGKQKVNDKQSVVN